MSVAYEILTAFKFQIDGRGVSGEGEQCTLPKVTAKTEEFMGGGMLGAVDVPMAQIEKMELEVKYSSFNSGSLGGTAILPGEGVPFVLRGNVSDPNGTQKPALVRGQGVIISTETDAIEVGKKVQTTVKMTLHAYSLTVAGETLIDIDINNLKFVTRGVDQMAGLRGNLGV